MKRFLMVVFVVFAFAGVARAGIDRTAVSRTGSDFNPCSLAQPCATFNKAIANTNPDGVLTALDSGTFDGFTIDRAMTVTVAAGAQVVVGVEPGKTWAVNINAPGQRVSLRGVSIKVTGSVQGIWVHDSLVSYIDDVVVEGNGCAGGCATGIFGRSGDMVIRNARIRNFFNGIVHNPIAASHALILDSVVHAQRIGISADNYARVTARNTVVAKAETGFSTGSLTAGVRPELTLTDCTAVENGTGVVAGNLGTVRMERTAVHRNTTGLYIVGGTLYSYGNNMVGGNTTNVSGAVTTVGLM